ncbi:heparan-alpha-glucosaminide N-acetyltransferase domain-containing protein [Maribacter confluentis]|uniref:Heparan-alpha-glucosaminide N-acetyltransferase domain-containing protein n=1 Tax=Maribacter confluentis TaxID=1656093 RepID=A0ABT8RR70_9FLAO|nr:heparan-alpha-glucosaminide N-acetyltransferase domain-containing protein [Maribacter confluentis]MDO1513423.1 heparan-alpha-glucosaminide N-acetyltransferase domain-containing protein [Maribacter confluentis]MDO1514873.1 heparan-alpha-glucosaminide N-acetyltransferase domain-containing protein [Maribacter confluentis]
MNTLKNRYLSLDVFRGMDVALMIIVNSPGNGDTSFGILKHAVWNGFTLTDLVFPTFLFVVGNAMSFSMKKYQTMGNAAFLKKIFKRFAIIFLLGFLMYWFPFFEDGHLKPISETRIFGVLQRIALCYLIAAVLIHYFKTRTVVIFSFASLIIYNVILVVFGDLTLTGNAVLKLDKLLIGPSHMYHGNGGVAFDPEGLLSTLPAVVNVIAGYLTGKFIQNKGQHFETVAKLLMIAALLIVAGFSWHQIIPFNKKLWSSSFVLLTCGIDLVIIAILMYLLDMSKPGKWTYFFEVFGRNTLFIYLLSELFIISLAEIKTTGTTAYNWIADNIFISIAGNYFGSLLFALWIMLTCWLIGYIMDKKGIYIKV